MNPLTNVKNIKKLSEIELKYDGKGSWHDDYKGSAWVFIGGLPYSLTEGDIICIFSQYGEVVNINLVRDKDTGKSKGFCFLCYEDQRSTTLAVDNLNSIKILERTLRVDHVAAYKAPNDKKGNEEIARLHMEGCAPKPMLPRIKQEIKEEVVKHDENQSTKIKKEKKHKHKEKEKEKDKHRNKETKSDKYREKRRSRSLSRDRKSSKFYKR